jgi:hypothetical protein
MRPDRLPLRLPQGRPDVDGDPLKGGGPQAEPGEARQQAVALAHRRPRRQVRHPQADLQGRRAVVQPQRPVEGGEAPPTVGAVIPPPGEPMLPVSGDELAHLGVAIARRAATLGAGSSVVLRQFRRFPALQEAAFQLGLHHLADVFDPLLNLVQRQWLVGQAFAQHVRVAGQQPLDQLIAFLFGHQAPPDHPSGRSGVGSTPRTTRTPWLICACLPGSWIAPAFPPVGRDNAYRQCNR